MKNGENIKYLPILFLIDKSVSKFPKFGVHGVGHHNVLETFERGFLTSLSSVLKSAFYELSLNHPLATLIAITIRHTNRALG